ncbi:glycosyltransferase family A protein [Mammaliicoccus sciuri]|uniref:glycosyltransferase family A protein n=1 Tax=Mammaliicoccus sciuri TaxID=1296 RepID=UPI00265B8FC7|nr:glycosyltransferase family A protein [Mammaliicoccus sciuri]MDO0952355.1 glycosyltransferase family A protein [Mammaliicoccus sciuri]
MFSVIISTYNGSKNIINTIENIRESIKKFTYEIIIINDGSTDDTKELLDSYKNNNHFEIINQSNKGISTARNMGISLVSEDSNYVVFIDDSDTVKKNFFRKINEFFTNNQDIDIVATPLIRTNKHLFKQHSLNYRFHSDMKVVNIHKDYKYIHFHIGGIAFRKEIFKNEHYRFDENLNFWEDAKFINNLLLDKEKYGLINDTAYYYNSENPNSLSKSAWTSEERYIPLIEKSYMYLIEKAKEKYGKTIKYVQYLIATHYIEYLKEHNQDKILNSPFFNEVDFNISSKKLFENIDSNIIYELKTNYYYKNYMLNLKQEELLTSKFVDQLNVYIHSYNLLNGNITFTFSRETCSLPSDSKVYLQSIGNKMKRATLVSSKRPQILGSTFNDFSRNIYKVKLPLISIFRGSNMIIIRNNHTYKIYNPSIIDRILKNIRKLKQKYRRK